MLELTLVQLAKKIGSNKGYVSGWETGAVNPPRPYLIKKLAKALRLKPYFLLLMAYVEKAPKEIRKLVELKLL